MRKYHIRSAVTADLDEIEKIYEYARRFMIENGNPTQWQNGYPMHDMLEADISEKKLYAVLDSGEIVGVFMYVIGEDPTYSYIENGAWLSDAPYGTIHRIASCRSGVFAAALEFCRGRCSHVRVDTHENNRPMQHLAEKYGFQRCGTIYVEDGTPRIAYEML